MIDSLDKRILNALLDDSRLSYRQIAKKSGVSVVTVMNRIKRMENEGFIKGYSARLDYDRLGYDIHVMIEVRISKGKLFQVERRIGIHPNVLAVYDHTGQSDATIIARFRDKKGMDTFLKKIQSYDFVERTETKLILNVLKDETVKLK
jgi:DNA-binding Lrp family transcriptional regulator